MIDAAGEPSKSNAVGGSLSGVTLSGSVTREESGSEWERLLSKYVRIWIWSLLFGVASGLGYSYIGVQVAKAWGPLAAAPLAFVVLGLIATLGSWITLFEYFRLCIIPEFFGHRDGEGSQPHEQVASAKGARLMSASYKYLLVAVMTRISVSALDLLFQTLGGGFR